eukprot:TRINITY_DN11377_c0_g1_i1.p1 TRINITY_DN11377_c0_g1~~TRINITY_DN11377_c0_g1_i1.p1  ORF type:complete len:393 (+),score=84.08 TRINITY_DN11377_c0_g1_i1:122-1300(+)
MLRRALRCNSRRYFGESSSCWEILGVEEKADMKLIREQYKKLAMKYHPDMPTGDLHKMKLVNRAFAEAKKGGPAATKPSSTDATSDNFSAPIEFFIWLLCKLFNLNIETYKEALRRRARRANGDFHKQQKQPRNHHRQKTERQQRQRQEEEHPHQWGEFSSSGTAHQHSRRVRRTVRIRSDASEKASAASASKFELLSQADQIASELHLKPRALWYNRDRLQPPAINEILKQLQQEQRDLQTDKDPSKPMTDNRLKWYREEIEKADQSHNLKRSELLLGILKERGEGSDNENSTNPNKGDDNDDDDVNDNKQMLKQSLRQRASKLEEEDLAIDRKDNIPISPTRLKWYHSELSKAAHSGDTTRTELLLTVLEGRGDVDLTDFERYYETLDDN